MSGKRTRRAETPAEPPEITVIIPTKDRWPMLSRSLQSVLEQEDVALEVIVVDDGSSDATPARLEELDDPRLRVLRNASSRGVASARNLGLSHTRAEWIAFLDDDDLWAPRKLRSQLERAAASGAGFVYTGTVVIDDDTGPFQADPVEAEDLQQGLLQRNVVGSPSTVLVRTDLVRDAGGFDERLSMLADWDLWIRLIIDGRAVAATCPEPLVAYVLHTQNMHRADVQSAIVEFRRLAAKHGRNGLTFGSSPFFRWIATSHRRNGRRFRAALVYLEAAARYRQAGDLVRGLGILLGERAMALGRRPPPPPAVPSEPPWIRRHRAD
jgi:glycosyltransferase involved in cell wall biosynthesis